MITARTVVARVVSIPLRPTFPKIATNEANIAEKIAYQNHIYYLSSGTSIPSYAVKSFSSTYQRSVKIASVKIVVKKAAI